MTYHLKLILCLATTLGTMAWVQTATSEEDSHAATSGSPVAYVYVSNTLKNGSVNEIEAYAAARDGKLTRVAGSPFQEDVTNMAVNGKYLFATDSNGFEIDAYTIESDGALRYKTTTNASDSDDCNTLGPLFLDHTGATLYDMEFNGSGCANNTYVSFAVDWPTGGLKDLGNSSGNRWLYLASSFIGNNVYAYTASCLEDMYWGIYGFDRNNKGLLTEIAIGAKPPAPPSGDFYCPSQAAADPTGHVAISMQAVNKDFNAAGAPRLATYTANSKGQLSTASKLSNMPETSVVNVTDLNMSPSGKLLAVGGTGGLQIFHFNGSSPITHYTGLLTKDEVDQFFWDEQNHLYAISRTAGKLFVFTVTPTSYSRAPGSPYSINKPQNIIVQILPERH